MLLPEVPTMLVQLKLHFRLRILVLVLVLRAPAKDKGLDKAVAIPVVGDHKEGLLVQDPSPERGALPLTAGK